RECLGVASQREPIGDYPFQNALLLILEPLQQMSEVGLAALEFVLQLPDLTFCPLIHIFQQAVLPGSIAALLDLYTEPFNALITPECRHFIYAAFEGGLLGLD